MFVWGCFFASAEATDPGWPQTGGQAFSALSARFGTILPLRHLFRLPAKVRLRQSHMGRRRNNLPPRPNDRRFEDDGPVFGGTGDGNFLTRLQGIDVPGQSHGILEGFIHVGLEHPFPVRASVGHGDVRSLRSLRLDLSGRLGASPFQPDRDDIPPLVHDTLSHVFAHLQSYRLGRYGTLDVMPELTIGYHAINPSQPNAFSVRRRVRLPAMAVHAPGEELAHAFRHQLRADLAKSGQSLDSDIFIDGTAIVDVYDVDIVLPPTPAVQSPAIGDVGVEPGSDSGYFPREVEEWDGGSETSSIGLPAFAGGWNFMRDWEPEPEEEPFYISPPRTPPAFDWNEEESSVAAEESEGEEPSSVTYRYEPSEPPSPRPSSHKGSCLRDPIPQSHRLIFNKYFIFTDPPDAPPTELRWDCLQRALVYGIALKDRWSASLQGRKGWKQLIELARATRQRLLSYEGPVWMEDLQRMAPALEVSVSVALYDKITRTFTRHDYPGGEHTIHLCLYSNHYFLVATAEHFAALLRCGPCPKCQSFADDLPIHVPACNSRRAQPNGNPGVGAGAPVPVARNVPLDKIHRRLGLKQFDKGKREEELTPLSDICVVDFETWRPEVEHTDGNLPRPVSHGQLHEVYAAGILHPIGNPSRPADVQVLYGQNSLIETCARLLNIAAGYSTKKPLYVYFYNGSGFDNLFLVDQMVRGWPGQPGLPPDQTIEKNGRLLGVSFLDGALIIRDIFLFTGCSLAKACKDYGVAVDLSKTHFNHELLTSRAALARYQPEITEYLKLDVVATAEVIRMFQAQFHRINKVNIAPAITLSQASFEGWRYTVPWQDQRHLTLPYSSMEDSEMRSTYKGGRVTPQYTHYQSPLYGSPGLTYQKLQTSMKCGIDEDACSLYPFVMGRGKACSEDGKTHTTPAFFCGEYQRFSVEYRDGAFHSRPTLDLPSPMQACQANCVADILMHPFNLQEEVEPFKYHGEDGWEAWWNRLARHWQSLQHDPETTPYFNLARHGCLVCVDVTPNPLLSTPVLGFKNDKGDTYWDLRPKEREWCVLDELVAAMTMGYVVTAVHTMYLFPVRLPLYDKFIETNFKEKAAAPRGSAAREVPKLTMNANSGKPAQRAVRQETKFISPERLQDLLDDPDISIISIEPLMEVPRGERNLLGAAELLNILQFEERLQKLEALDFQQPLAYKVVIESDSPQPSKPVYLAAQITAYARMHINRVLYKAGLLTLESTGDPEKIGMLYTDTDSVVMPFEAVEKLKREAPYLVGDNLGQMSDELEGGRILRYVGVAPKFYCILYMMPDNSLWLKVRCKGIPHRKDPIQINGEEDEISQQLAWQLGAGIIQQLAAGRKMDLADLNTPVWVRQASLPLGSYLYLVTEADGSEKWYAFLTTDIFEGILTQRVRNVTVYFTSMRRRTHGDDGVNVMAVEHMLMVRGVNSMVWWLKENPSRAVCDQGAFGYPRGHLLYPEEAVCIG